MPLTLIPNPQLSRRGIYHKHVTNAMLTLTSSGIASHHASAFTPNSSTSLTTSSSLKSSIVKHYLSEREFFVKIEIAFAIDIKAG